MKETISKKQLREFGLLIGFGFPFLIGWLIPFVTGHQFRIWTLLVAVPGFIFGITAPKLLYYPFKLWMKLGHYLGWLNSHIILGMVFIIVLQPIALFMRLFKYDPLRRRMRQGEITYREDKLNHHTELNRIF